MNSPRIVLCEACGSEGWHCVVTHMSPEDGCPDGYRERCDWCEGTGGEIIETQPIELCDLDEMSGATLSISSQHQTNEAG